MSWSSTVIELITPGSNLNQWRERILKILLYSLAVIGTPMFVVNFVSFADNNQWGVAVFLAVTYLGIITVTFYRKATYKIRAGSVILVAYLLGPLALTYYGLSGDGRIWLSFFVLLSSLLFGLRFGVVSAGIATITFIVYGYLMTSGTINVPPVEVLANSGDLNGWVSTGLSLLFTTLVLLLSTGILVSGMDNSLGDLEKSYKSERKLSEQLTTEQTQLEARSQELEKRVTQIRTASEISRSLGSILEPQELLQQVADLIKERFNLYYVGIFLIDDGKRYAELSVGTGEAGKIMLAEGHKLSIGGSSLVGWSITNKIPRISQEAEGDLTHFTNSNLPNTQSELALPIRSGTEALGSISLQSTQPNAFDEDDVLVLEGIADSLGIALENARLFQQFENSLKEIQQLNYEYLGDAWTNVVEDSSTTLSAESKNEFVSDGVDASAEITIPLTLRDEQVIGNIMVEANRSQWTSEEIEFLEAISNQAALALESARLLEDTQKRVRREQALNQLTTQFALTLDFDSLLQNVVKELGKLPKVAEASIHIASPHQNGNPVQPEFPEVLEDKPDEFQNEFTEELEDDPDEFQDEEPFGSDLAE